MYYKLRILILQKADYVLQITDYVLQITDYVLQITESDIFRVLSITNHGLY
jgi:hypothetical protein